MILPVPPRREPENKTERDPTPKDSGPPPPLAGDAEPLPGPPWRTCLVMLLVFLASPVWCCCLGEVLFYPIMYAQYGRGPAWGVSLTSVYEGMTPDEVVAIGGEPHKRRVESDGRITWTYYHDCLQFSYTHVCFDIEGRVTFVGGD